LCGNVGIWLVGRGAARNYLPSRSCAAGSVGVLRFVTGAYDIVVSLGIESETLRSPNLNIVVGLISLLIGFRAPRKRLGIVAAG